VTPAVTLHLVGRPVLSASRTFPAIPAIAAAINAIAAIALAMLIAPGVSLTYGPDNAAYVATHLAVWRSGWALWIAAAVSLLAFFVWWADRAGWPITARAAVAIAALGVVADVSAEARLIAWTPDLDVGAALRQSGVVANACYSIAGAMLMLVSPELPRGLALWGWAVWALGIALSIAAVISNDLASQALTAAIFALFVPWLLVAGRRLA
jgi:hypothetical protein